MAASGALQVCGVPGLEKAAAFLKQSEIIKECMDAQGATSATMADDTIRRTVGAPSIRGVPQRFRSTCADDLVTELRSLVDLAGKMVLMALSNDQAEIFPDYSLRDVAYLGDHLEHVHLYEQESSHTNRQKKTLPLHTDGGLMIAMVAGTTDGLELELVSGDIVNIEYQTGCVLVLAGEGLKQWTRHQVARPAPHAFQLQSQSRAWYGKMFLAPADALIHDITFAEYRKATTKHVETISSATLGCLGQQDDIHQRVLSAASPQLCSTQDGDDGILCWTQCVSIEHLDCDEAYCIDYDSGDVLDGSKHCPGGHSFDTCGPQCLLPNEENGTLSGYDYDTSGFCPGDGITMYMDGFRSIFEKHRPACINIWNTKWTLDTRFRFAMGIIGALVTGATVEALVALRRKMHTNPAHHFLTLPLHLCQCILGYLAMFIAMTYSVELFASVCLGATLGYRIFNYRFPSARQDPCCAAAEQSLSLTSPDAFDATSNEEPNKSPRQITCPCGTSAFLATATTVDASRHQEQL
eukprot:CAMPEP_0197303866 /NCGR_PEP_ID=MMETSP0890-20130614/51910_1 /TAXON_ID=44058 ORGANISM="Aureoumbra lagunensis, Strain CCMP1510" /NCGR_SAMPLE_ID=MMETSP0890 /ASSEMBLY_ACC=CAM_ASM_000533 /LENGTH=522 /DNA_ID=CAMNT_0042783771 /DNA_START=167 /DNA_END=1735 /DNA_ORIENTATION=+